MAQAIQAVDRGGFDMMLLTKTNISTTVYCRNRLEYVVKCSAERPSSAGGYQGGIEIVTKERPVGWGIESTCYHRPNMVSCEIFTGLTRNPLVGTYLPPSTLEHLPDLEEALKRFKDPIVLGDLNVDLNEERNLQRQQVTDLLVE